MKKNGSTIFLTLIFIIGLSLLLYPTFSDWWNSFHQSRAIVDYDKALARIEPEDYTSYFKKADAYNKKLSGMDYPLLYTKEDADYEDILNVTGSGMIGYIEIPKIDVSLPFYHGTSESVLQTAVGHLQGSSMPVGGKNTHSVLSAHRGLPSARLFTDLDKMEIDDVFTLTVLDRLLTYQVDQILIVEPQEIEALSIEKEKDYCTLITCTPYGINTHRMLVRGHRIDNEDTEEIVHITADAVQIEPILVAPFVAAPMLLILLVALMIPKPGKKGRKQG